jgi:RNA polymerase sigma factor (sigma-70 family)
VNDLSENVLLRDYVEKHSEAAFAELVRRYVDFVYSTARRMVGNEQAAQDVTQSVFVALARDARKLIRRPVLSGWLHCTSRNIAANALRSDARRRARELQAAIMNESQSDQPGDLWERIAPQIDAALGELSRSDRDAILLRYFQNKSIREVAQILQTTESAAHKRVNRSVERLRKIIAKHGVVAGVSGLTVAISANAVQQAPTWMAAASSSAGLLSIQTSTKGIVTTLIQKILATTAVVAIVGSAGYALKLRSDLLSLSQQESLLAAQLEQSNRDRDDALRRAGLLAGENESLHQATRDLARLQAKLALSRAQESNAAPHVTATIPETPSDTNVQVQLNARFASLSDDQLQTLGIQWTTDADGGGHGQLSVDQYLEASNALAKVNVTTAACGMSFISGAKMRMTTAVPLLETALPPTDADLEAVDKISALVTLNTQPIYSADDGGFTLSLLTALRQRGAAAAEDQPPVMQASNQLALLHGQTAVLEREIPAGAWPSDFTNTPSTPRKLVVFLTPEAIDGYGNPLVR